MNLQTSRIVIKAASCCTLPVSRPDGQVLPCACCRCPACARVITSCMDDLAETSQRIRPRARCLDKKLLVATDHWWLRTRQDPFFCLLSFCWIHYSSRSGHPRAMFENPSQQPFCTVAHIYRVGPVTVVRWYVSLTSE